MEEERFQLLGVVTPEAHARIDKLLPYFIQQAEKFQALDRIQLAQFAWFDSANLEIKNQIRLTE